MTSNDTFEQVDLIDICRRFHSKEAEYTFFSCAHGTFLRIDHILGHRKSLNKLKKTEMISSIFSTFCGMKVEINYKNLRNDKCVIKQYATEQPVSQWRNQKRNLKNTLRQMKMKCNISVGCSKGNSKWELQNDTVLFQETMRNI